MLPFAILALVILTLAAVVAFGILNGGGNNHPQNGQVLARAPANLTPWQEFELWTRTNGHPQSIVQPSCQFQDAGLVVCNNPETGVFAVRRTTASGIAPAAQQPAQQQPQPLPQPAYPVYPPQQPVQVHIVQGPTNPPANHQVLIQEAPRQPNQGQTRNFDTRIVPR